MEGLPIPKTLIFYQLIKMTTKGGINLHCTGVTPPSGYIGSGFYRTRDEAEHNRTLETLKEQDGATYHVFEVSFPNPVYKE